MHCGLVRDNRQKRETPSLDSPVKPGPNQNNSLRDENFLEPSLTITTSGHRENSPLTTLKKKLTRFKLDKSTQECRECMRVSSQMRVRV